MTVGGPCPPPRPCTWRTAAAAGKGGRVCKQGQFKVRKRSKGQLKVTLEVGAYGTSSDDALRLSEM